MPSLNQDRAKTKGRRPIRNTYIYIASSKVDIVLQYHNDDEPLLTAVKDTQNNFRQSICSFEIVVVTIVVAQMPI
jgi:hypothetical protein